MRWSRCGLNIWDEEPQLNFLVPYECWHVPLALLLAMVVCCCALCVRPTAGLVPLTASLPPPLLPPSQKFAFTVFGNSDVEYKLSTRIFAVWGFRGSDLNLDLPQRLEHFYAHPATLLRGVGSGSHPMCWLTAFCPFPPPATSRLPPATRRSKTEGKLIIFYVGFLFSWVSSLVQFTAQHPNIHADRTRQERKEQLTVARRARASPQQWNWLYAPPS